MVNRFAFHFDFVFILVIFDRSLTQATPSQKQFFRAI